MHRHAGIIAASVILLWISVSLLAMQKSVTASDAWIRLPAAGATEARAFLVIDNPTMYDVYLVSASAEVANSVQFREPASGRQGGAAVKEVTAPAYGKIELKPEGLHLLLSGLKRTLEAGETIPITISLGAEAITVNAVVKN